MSKKGIVVIEEAGLSVRFDTGPDTRTEMLRDAMQEAEGNATRALAALDRKYENRLEKIRQEAGEKAITALKLEIEAGKQFATERTDRATVALGQAFEMERSGTEQFRTWIRNYPPVPDREMWAAMVADGTMAGWFGRYRRWLAEVGERA